MPIRRWCPPGVEALVGERWSEVSGYAGLYAISDHGRVYAHARSRQCGHAGSAPQWRPGELLKPNPVGNPRTHLAIALTKDGVRRHFKVHHLVLEAFVEPRPAGLKGLHWDDDPNNNHVSNLRWGTSSDNQKDRVRLGTHHMANRTHCPQLHEYTPENTYHPPGRPTRRHCRECMRDNNRRRRRAATNEGISA